MGLNSIRHTRSYRIRRALVPAVAACAVLAAGPLARPAIADPSATQAPSNTDLQAQVDALKQQIANLQAQQNDILKMLGQLTAIAQGKPAPPDPAAPTVPVVATLSTAGLQVEGQSTAKVAMVEFTDFECSYCGRYAREVYPQIFANYVQYGKIQYFYHPMPLPVHPHSVQAAEAAQCAADQGKFWEMHDSLFANQGALEERDFLGRAQALGLDVSKFSGCMLADNYSAGLKNGENDWEKKGIAGTPAFMIGIIQPDGTIKIDYQVNGAMPYNVYQTDLDAELAKG